MSKLTHKEQLIIANNRCLQLQEQLDANNKNYIELNSRYLKLLNTNGELLKLLMLAKSLLEKSEHLHRQIIKALDKIEKEE